MRTLFWTLLCLFSAQSWAHPHSFLDMKNKIVIVNERFIGVEMNWWLDEITSAELLYEINESEDKAAAIKKITNEMTLNAVSAHYFSELYDANDRPVKFSATPQNAELQIHDHRVVFHFMMPLAEPLPLKGERLRLYTFEPSYYLAMVYEQARDLSASPQSLCRISLEQPKVNQQLRLYASGLDKNQTADLPPGSLSLGAQFAQQVNIVCNE